MSNFLRSFLLSSLVVFNSSILEAQEFVKLEIERSCDHGYSIDKDKWIITFSIKPKEVYEIIFLSESWKILTKINWKNEDKVCYSRDFRIWETTKILFRWWKHYWVLEREYWIKTN